jgi:GAF domain-containing protein
LDTSRRVAFCARTILGNETFVVPDATAGERFHDHPLVTDDPNIRLHAGRPLVLGNGLHVGALRAIDRVPRQVPEERRPRLRDLGKLVEGELISRELSESFGSLLEEVRQAQRTTLIDPLTRVWKPRR